MALVLADRVRDTTTTTGTGTVTLSGTAPTGYQNFSAIGNGNTTYYTINGGSEWEVGIGTYSSTGPTLARTTVLASSNSGSLVNFSAGTKDVFVTYPAEKSVNYDALNNVGIGIVPSTKLDVAGSIWSRPGGAVGAVAALFADASSGVNGITLSASFVSGGYGPIKLDAGGSERARIDTGGNLLVGSTATPSGSGVNVQIAGNATTRLWMTPTGGRVYYIETSSSSNALQFIDGTAGAERMRIDSSGNVGIGTSSPGGKLDVAGVFKVQVNGDVYGASGNAGAILLCGGSAYNAGGAVKLYGSSGGDAVAFYTGAFSERMRIDSSGNVGVGTATPGAKLQVQLATSFSWGSAWGSGTAVFGGGTSTAGALGIAYNDTDGASFGAIVPGVAWKDIGFYSNGLIFRTNGGTEAMRITPSQNVGIGNTSPGYRLDITAGDTTAGLGYAARLRSNATAAAAALQFTNNGVSAQNGLIACTDSGVLTVQGDGGSSAIVFRTNGNERARIDASGNLLVGTTAPLGGNTSNEYKTTVAGSWPLTLNANDRGLLIRNSAAIGGFYAYFEYNGGTNNGSIGWSGGTTFYNTVSDARTKNNIADAPEAGDLIDEIRVRSWDFKVDGSHWRYGMVAQELIEVVPEAVFVPEDPEQMMGVDYAKLVPLLVKEVQSLRARVAQLEGK